MRAPLLAALLVATAAHRLPAQGQLPVSPAAAQSLDDSVATARLFASQCGRCHGIDGTGGLGPSLRQPRLRRAPTDEALAQVILGGIPGTAMAGFWNLSEDEAHQLASYVRSLGRLPPEVVPGDSARGRRLYLGAGNCSTCHILGGVGSGWAPDLSDVGRRLNATFLRQALTAPGANQPVSPLPSVHGPYPAYLVVEATTADGATIHGTRVSEDDFTLVLRGDDGQLHSLDRTSLRRLEKLPGQSPMPNYGSVFGPAELDDLIAYLASLKGEP